MSPFKLLCFMLLLFNYTFAQKNKVEPIDELFEKYTNVRDFTISKNGKEAYFTMQDPTDSYAVIACIKKNDSGWGEPELVSFAGEYRDIEPFLTPDQLRLFFSSNRPIDSSLELKDYDIWYVKREGIDSKWSSPIRLEEPVNTVNNEFYPSLSANNNLYYTSDGPLTVGRDDIFFSEWTENGYAQPSPLSEIINGIGYEFNAYISENENCLIYTKYTNEEGSGSGDLYISFKNNKGAWILPENLGKNINSERMDYCPFYDEANKTLYFTSKRTAVKQKKFKTINAFLKEINQYENGESRLYKTKLDFNLFQGE